MRFNDLIQCLLQLRARRDHLRMIAGGSLCLLGLVLALAQAAIIFFSISVTETTSRNTDLASAGTPVAAPDSVAAGAAVDMAQVVALADADGTASPAQLRVLAPRQAEQPQQPAVAKSERRLLEDYAKQNGRELVWVLAANPEQLLPALRAGKGDLIAGRNQRPSQQLDGIEYSQPWSVSRQRMVTRRAVDDVGSLDDIHAGTIAVSADSPAWSLLQARSVKHEDLSLVKVNADQKPRALLQKVSRGDYDMVVADSAALAESMSAYPELEVAFDLPDAENRVWAVRADAGALRESIDSYLSREVLSRSVAEVRFDDLPDITERRQLRVITYQSPANYYLADNGELSGFEYDLVRKFARQRGLRVEVVVAPSQQDMVRWLLEGRGDLIAASIPAASVRSNPRLDVSRPYNYAAPLIVGRESEQPLIDARDLNGRRIVLPAGSPHRQLLQRYHQRGINVSIVEAEASLSQTDILKRVALGIYDLTLIDSHKSRALLAAAPNARVHFPISEPLPHSWVVRADDDKLLKAVNKYIADTYRSRDYNVLHARYFEHPIKYKPLEKSSNELLALGGELSPYDELVRRYAEQFGFDWRLIVAQMYQESRFNPQAESSAGAIGLMQMLPTTASDVGITELYEPEKAIHAGVRYLSYLYNRFDTELAFEDRVWFSLASYNAGFQRVEQARARAADMGLDPDRWFDNVEKAMLTMSKDTSCSCGQPVAYVREIRSRYHNYVRLTRVAQYAWRNSNTVRHDT